MDPLHHFQDQIPYRLGANEALQDAMSQATNLIHGMNSNRNPGIKIGGIVAQAAACEAAEKRAIAAGDRPRAEQFRVKRCKLEDELLLA